LKLNGNLQVILIPIQQEGGEPLASGRERRAMGRDRWGDIYASVPVKVMIALYDYDPQELSPNVDSEVLTKTPVRYFTFSNIHELNFFFVSHMYNSYYFVCLYRLSCHFKLVI
jgi:hypothetical protein